MPLPDTSFHDAEVVGIRIDRAGPTVEVDLEGYAQTERARRYLLRFIDVDELELSDLNHQNVLFDLRAVQRADGRFDVYLDHTYGINGHVRCRAIEWS